MEAVLEESQALVEATPVHWTPLTRVLFRCAFIYFFVFIFAYGNGTIFDVIPWVGEHLDQWMTWPWRHAAVWVGHHVFHLTGPYAEFHPTGSGDTALDWVLQLLYVVVSLVGGLIWTAVAIARGNRRHQYATLYAWLRFGVRLTAGFFMVDYGMAKLIPRQMPPISIGILNEPVGQMSPMTFLWAFVGMNPLYEMVCGAAEIMGGAMILFRRTALAGALLSAFVMTNVLLYNMFFDTPVKLFAANLLLACLFIALPDVTPLIDFFFRHKAAVPAGIWIPPTRRKGFRVATRVVEIAFTVMFLLVGPGMDGYQTWKNRADNAKTSPLMGAWHVDASHAATGAFVTGEKLPTIELYVDSIHRAFRRSSDLALWRTYLEIDDKADTVQFYGEGGEPTLYAINMPDANHLILVSRAPKADPKVKPDPKAKPFVTETVSLTRTPVPTHYRLLERGFHWVNEWGLER